MQFTLHATRRASHGGPRLVQATAAWSVNTPTCSVRMRGSIPYGHATTAMHKLGTPIRPLALTLFHGCMVEGDGIGFDFRRSHTKNKNKKWYPGFLAHAVIGMFYSVVDNQRQPQYTQMFYSVRANRGQLLYMMHFLPQLSDFVPLRNGFYSFRAQTA